MYGIIMSALIHTMIGKHHLKPDMPGEFFEQSVTKMLDHYISMIPTRSSLSVQYCLLSAWTGVVGKAVTTVARAKKPVHNRFNVFFINLMLLSFWV